jgi:hypothetical protein
MLYGTDDSPPSSLSLNAGPLSAVFQPELAILRYIRYRDQEIVRAIYAAVRDRVWGTVTPVVSNVVAAARRNAFHLSFDVDCRQGDIDFGWQGVITGASDGTIRFEFNGRARSTFLKNRLGFVVLHPIKECAGKPCVVESTNGLKTEGTFPASISPHQPFLNMRAISHQVDVDLRAEARFEGDVFEMEDHRNWTDGNYKTYCTPLERPYPVEIRREQEIKQAITIRLQGAAKPARWSRPVEVEIGKADGNLRPLPAIGAGLAVDQPTLHSTAVARLRAARLKHLRADLRLWENEWKQLWERARTESLSLGAPIEAAVFVTGEADRELAELSALPPARVARWLLYHRDENSTREQWVKLARKHLKGAPVGAGTNTYFTELNRERPPATAIDLTCYSINPQVHAFDNESLVENLEAQADTVRSCHKFAGGKPIAVTPVTLRPRFNPQAKEVPEAVVEGKLPFRIDPRQPSLFGAAWTLGSVKYLAENGVASVTYYETHGWNGWLETADGSPLPEQFRSIAGGVFPLYHVLADVNEFAGAMVLPLTSADPLRACALALQLGSRRRVMVANLTSDLQSAVLDARTLGRRALVRTLDESNFNAAVREPEVFRRLTGTVAEAAGDKLRVTLLPYGVARLDGIA